MCPGTGLKVCVVVGGFETKFKLGFGPNQASGIWASTWANPNKTNFILNETFSNKHNS
jgi:hypothetical protein